MSAAEATNGLASRLANVWLTHALDQPALHALAGLGRVVEVAPSDFILREGELNDTLAIVLEGRVALRVRVPERGQVTILTVEQGDVVGWSAVVPPHRAMSSAVALSQSRLATFDGPALRQALLDDEHLATQFYPLLLAAVARRLDGTRLQLLDLFSQRWVEPW
jgi:CRP-like cAMP-binding protein